MNQPINLKTTSLAGRNSIGLAPSERGFVLTVLAVTWFALSPAPKAFGVTPAPDGGYPRENTAEGDSALFSLTTGSLNTATGSQALFSNTTGNNNTATGAVALEFNTTGFNNTATGLAALQSNTSGSNNTANGVDTLFTNTTGSGNTASGINALFSNTTGGGSTATGSFALQSNTSGFENTATGVQTLFSNTTGACNTAIGGFALNSNTTGCMNTAAGDSALHLNSTGSNNTATGVQALGENDTGSNNTATGFNALFGSADTLSTGNNNTATGFASLGSNSTGNNNTATGVSALLSNTTGNNNTAEGFQALANNTGSNNIALGANAGINLTTGDNNIYMAASGLPSESNTIRIGKGGVQKIAYMQGISGATVASGVTVIVDTKGHLGTVQSSARFKDEIKPMDKASEAILALKPVTFHYKKELDPDGIPQFGLVAEQVEKVNPALVVRDEDGKVNTVRYEAVNAMLLNEFLKEHRKVEEQDRELLRQQAAIAQQQKQIEALMTGLQKVNAQLALTKSAPQVVLNNQ